MKKEEFEKELTKAFTCGGGGTYFKEHYLEALEDEKQTLQNIAKGLKSDILSETKDAKNYNKDEMDKLKKLLKFETETDKECLGFFAYYLEDRQVAFPELCGSIVGALAKKEMYDEARKLIGLDILDDEEELYWDS